MYYIYKSIGVELDFPCIVRNNVRVRVSILIPNELLSIRISQNSGCSLVRKVQEHIFSFCDFLIVA